MTELLLIVKSADPAGRIQTALPVPDLPGNIVFALYVAPSCQELEPPTNPERFKRQIDHPMNRQVVRISLAASVNLKRPCGQIYGAVMTAQNRRSDIRSILAALNR